MAGQRYYRTYQRKYGHRPRLVATARGYRIILDHAGKHGVWREEAFNGTWGRSWFWTPAIQGMKGAIEEAEKLVQRFRIPLFRGIYLILQIEDLKETTSEEIGGHGRPGCHLRCRCRHRRDGTG